MHWLWEFTQRRVLPAPRGLIVASAVTLLTAWWHAMSLARGHSPGHGGMPWPPLGAFWGDMGDSRHALSPDWDLVKVTFRHAPLLLAERWHAMSLDRGPFHMTWGHALASAWGLLGAMFGHALALLAVQWHAMSLAWGPFHVTWRKALASPWGLLGQCGGLNGMPWPRT